MIKRDTSKRSPIKTGFLSCLFTSLIKLSSFLKVSWIVGSYTAVFSATSIMMPLSGAFLGVAGSLVVFGLSLVLKLFLIGNLPFKYLAYHIPGLFAALYIASASPLIRVLVPAMCMIGFILHPVGAQAAPYTLFWLIPIFIYFWPRKSIFLASLGSTFTAHAVGSVIWIYAVPMTAQAWLGLIPVVIVERLVFAGGMILMHLIICKVIEQKSKMHTLLSQVKQRFSMQA